MKSFHLFLLLLLTSCTQPQAPQTTIPINIPPTPKKQTNESFQKIIESAELNGVILIYNPQTQIYTSNDFERSEKGFPPASTFKIPNSIIALETGVVENVNTLFKWDGQKRAFKMWEQDLIFENVFKKSCLPCYQEIARNIGVDSMTAYLKKLNYSPNVKVDSASLDLFWINGKSTISAFEQIDFLSRFYHSKLPISERTEKIVKEIMLIDEKSNYRLSGKTGWYVNEDENLGWFVGYVEKGDDVYFMATNVDPKDNFDMEQFPRIRLQILKQAMKHLGII